jgi:purine-binding chemotaxis protein CheW
MNRLRQPVSGPASANQRWIDDKIVNIETKSAGSLTGKYLTFNLQAESYGIDVLKVREIIRHTIITLVPQMPAYIRGVINLRGKIIPVMDLRIRFEFATANSDQTCVIVVQVTLPDGKATQMGLVVDGVEEVLNIGENDIEETPNFGGQICTDYIIGIAKVKGAVKTLLDIDGIVGSGNGTLKSPAPATASPVAIKSRA